MRGPVWCRVGAALAPALRGPARPPSPLCDLAWKSLAVLELTALPSIQPESWVPMLRETDAVLVWGGDVLYLCHWMQQSGVADLLPSLAAVSFSRRRGLRRNLGRDLLTEGISLPMAQPASR
jgi:hypothetical protein